MNLSRFNFSMVILFCAGLLAMLLFPKLDLSLNPTSQHPGIITFAGVGVTLIVLTVLVLYFGLQTTVSLKKQFIIYAIFYNSFIIIAKFILSPMTLYYENQWITFNGGLGSIFGTGTGDLVSLATAAVVIFFLYVFVFSRIYSSYKGKVEKILKPSKTNNKTKKPSLPLGVGMIIGALLMVSFTGGAVLLIIFPFSAALQYLDYLFSTAEGLLIAAAIVGAIIFASAALRDLSKQAVVLKNAALLGSFFWVAISFLLVFHALWVVYFLIIMNLWPLKAVVPK